MAETKAQKAAAETAAQDEIEGTDEARGVPVETGGVMLQADEAAPAMKAYTSDRNLAEVNANVVFYMDPKSDLGKRLLATGYVTETDDPQA